MRNCVCISSDKEPPVCVVPYPPVCFSPACPETLVPDAFGNLPAYVRIMRICFDPVTDGKACMRTSFACAAL